MQNDRIFTRDLILDMAMSCVCSLNYFVLLVNIVGFASTTFGATPGESGLAAGLYVIGGLISRLLFGKYIELFGRKRMTVIFMFLGIVMSALYFGVSSLPLLYAVRFLHGMVYGISSTCTSDIAAKLIPESRRGQGLGYFYLSITVSMAVGPLLGLELGRTGDYNLVFSVGLIMYSIAMLCALLIHVDEEELTPEQKKEAKSFSFKNLFQLSAVPYGAISMVFYFAYSGVASFIASYSEEIGMVETATYFYIIVAAGTLISRFTAGRIFDVRGPNIIIIPAFLSFFASMLIFATTRNEALFLASGFFMGFSISIVYTICQAIVISKSNPERYGVTTSTFASVTDLGTGLGPMILGLLMTAYGFSNMYIICAFVALFSMFMYWVIHGHRQFRQDHTAH